MTAYDSLWQLMAAYDSLWQHMAGYDSLWQLMTTFDNCWRFLIVSLWPLMAAYLLATIHCSNLAVVLCQIYFISCQKQAVRGCQRLSEAGCRLLKASCHQLSIIELNHVIGCYWPTVFTCYRQTVIRWVSCHGKGVISCYEQAVMCTGIWWFNIWWAI